MDVVARDDGVVGAAVEEQTGVDAVVHVVVRHPDVVAALGRDDAVITFRLAEKPRVCQHHNDTTMTGTD